MPSVPHFPATIQKSGAIRIVLLNDQRQAKCDKWSKRQHCQVRPVFEPSAGRFAFFVDSHRLDIAELVTKNEHFIA